MTWQTISTNARGWIALVGFVAGVVGGAFALGAATSGAVGSHKDLPLRVQAVEVRLNNVEPALVEIQCILRSQVEGVDAARCLATYRRP